MDNFLLNFESYTMRIKYTITYTEYTKTHTISQGCVNPRLHLCFEEVIVNVMNLPHLVIALNPKEMPNDFGLKLQI